MKNTASMLTNVILWIVLFGSVFFVGITSSQVTYDPLLDVTADGYGGIDDIVAVAEHFGASGTPINWTQLVLEVSELQAEVDALNATLNSFTDSVNAVEDIVLELNADVYEIPLDYYVTDACTLKIEHLPNLVDKLGGMTQALVESKIKRLVIEVEAYAENSMVTFSGPCWTSPGYLSEDAGKARWELEFKNADGSSYSTTDWKLLRVTAFLK